MAPPKSKLVMLEGRRKSGLLSRTPGVVGRNDKADPNNGALYCDQLRQLNIELKKQR